MFIKRISFAATLALSLWAAGCQNSKAPLQQSSATPDKAVLISGGNGGVVAVYLPSDDATHPLMLCASDTAPCPECQAAAVKYFQTGVLDPKCSRTGATRTIASRVTPSFSHN